MKSLKKWFRILKWLSDPHHAKRFLILINLETVTNQIAEVDFGAMVKNVDDLVVTSQAGVEQAMDQISAIDFKTLNQAIKDLSDVVAPLAKFFNVFG